VNAAGSATFGHSCFEESFLTDDHVLQKRLVSYVGVSSKEEKKTILPVIGQSQ
jgi:hypothetical protein